MRLRRVLGAGVLLVVAVLAPVVILRHTDTGPVLRTVTVGKVPGMVAVDARTYHAFVTNSADHTVSMLDASSGSVLRTVAVGQEADAVSVDTPTGRAFVKSDAANTLSVLNAVSGTLLRTVTVNVGDLAVVDQTGHVLVDGGAPDLSGGTVAMLDGRTGTVLHTDTRVGAAVWGVAVDGATHRAFFTDFDANTVSVVDTSSGRVLGAVKVGIRPVSVGVDALTGRAFVTNNGDDTVTILDARSGTVLRAIKVGPNPARVVVDERTGRVFVVHGRGGPRYASHSSLALFASINTSGTTMLDARSGAVLGSVAVGGSPVDDVGYVDAINVAVDQRRGRVFVINQTATAALNNAVHGSVSVLDATTGRLLRTIPVGRHPISLAVDEATARLFVVNTNSGCVSADTWGWIPGSIRHWLPLISQPPKPKCGMPGSVTVIDTSRL